MKKRKLGNTDLNLTTVGLGTWAIGGPWQFGWGPQDDSQAIKSILKGQVKIKGIRKVLQFVKYFKVLGHIERAESK